jgi:hypothetical protein
VNNCFILIGEISLKFSGNGLKLLAQADSEAETQVGAQHARDCEQSIHWDPHQFGRSQASKDHGEETEG